MAEQEVHISSLIIHVKPEGLVDVKHKISALPDAEIYGDSEEGKIIVVLETSNQKFVTDIIDKINNFEHVLSTSLVFHQIETIDPSCEDDL
ncbi:MULTISPECIES: chaperone NapD [unclassified Moritella]|uniref:chaperone NapD n=1 Tax=unclassified Moritella TaxID=2637987 RepID=UPI001BA96334|nr:MULTISPECIES: chaperone NapD [unclassified Moritella]QUM85292.1 chaperone NapD [Moritella sp. 28]QUM89516.1 chaperone NapD [Moritella sp. 36]